MLASAVAWPDSSARPAQAAKAPAQGRRLLHVQRHIIRYCWLTQMGGLEGKALQDAFGFAPGSGGKAARTGRKKENVSGAAGPRTPTWRVRQQYHIKATNA